VSRAIVRPGVFIRQTVLYRVPPYLNEHVSKHAWIQGTHHVGTPYYGQLNALLKSVEMFPSKLAVQDPSM
jgi:hypothetical protein